MFKNIIERFFQHQKEKLDIRETLDLVMLVKVAEHLPEDKWEIWTTRLSPYRNKKAFRKNSEIEWWYRNNMALYVKGNYHIIFWFILKEIASYERF